MTNSKRIAIIGAGPIGIEALLYARRLGHEAELFEAGRIGDHVLRWGHVRLFSPGSMNGSPLGRGTLRALGRELPDPDAYETGAELVAHYLLPLARSPELRDSVHEGCRVVAIGRAGADKAHPLGEARRGSPFRLLVEGAEGESERFADIVLDCSGVYGNPNRLGDGGIPALGERGIESEIDYHLPDLADGDRGRFEGRRVAVVGAGASAATALDSLIALPGTRVEWIVRGDAPEPYRVVDDDPLPERDRLYRQANRLARTGAERLTLHQATTVREARRTPSGLSLRLANGNGERSIEVERLLALVGYSPDRSLYRELQVHECYASLGPMALASTLLEGDGDCLKQVSAGAGSLRNPEPDFFVLGSKSYGKNSSFLIRLGLSQIREAFSLIEGRPALDLYAA